MQLNDQKVFLKSNVMIEPLFNQWHAWSGLIAPATAAMFTANSHLKIMQSFVAAPNVHTAALKNPVMRGGPFINYDASKVPQIKALIESTLSGQSHLLALAEAIKQLDEILTTQADGFSLESLYQRVPEQLKGYVELVYDLNNSPSIRFIEGLLYKSPYYDESSQSLALAVCDQDFRPFALSTPQIGGDEAVFLRLPFRANELDELVKMKSSPYPLGYIREVFNIKEQELSVWSKLFTATGPRRRAPYVGGSVRVSYFGHACVLIETAELSVLLDPLVSYEINNDIPRYTYHDLPESIDYVLITHNHQDHCQFEALLQLRHRIKNVIVPKNDGGGLADPSLKLALQNIGFNQVTEIDEMENLHVTGGIIQGLPFLGEHADLKIRSKLAYLITLNGKSILCAADSNNLEPKLYKHISRLIGGVDILFLGMECDGGPLSWLYGPLLTKPIGRKMDQSRRLNGSDFQRGLELVDILNPNQVYIYAMGQEPWLTYLTSIEYTEESRPILESNKLVEECRSRGIISERLFGCKEIYI